MTPDTERRDVVVVGGGQAGLAIGRLLAQQGRRLTILDAADAPAAAWRSRWDSLRLFTPVRYDSLPGRAFPGHPDTYPGRGDGGADHTHKPPHIARAHARKSAGRPNLRSRPGRHRHRPLPDPSRARPGRRP